jgi:hypothetical protein
VLPQLLTNPCNNVRTDTTLNLTKTPRSIIRRFNRSLVHLRAGYYHGIITWSRLGLLHRSKEDPGVCWITNVRKVPNGTAWTQSELSGVTRRKQLMISERWTRHISNSSLLSQSRNGQLTFRQVADDLVFWTSTNELSDMPVIFEFMDWLMALIKSDIILKVAFWKW